MQEKYFNGKKTIDFMNQLAYKIKRGEVSDVLISYVDKGGTIGGTVQTRPIPLLMMLESISEEYEKVMKGDN